MLRNALAPPRVAEPGAHDGRVVATMASKVAVNMQLMLLMLRPFLEIESTICVRAGY